MKQFRHPVIPLSPLEQAMMDNPPWLRIHDKLADALKPIWERDSFIDQYSAQAVVPPQQAGPPGQATKNSKGRPPGTGYSSSDAVAVGEVLRLVRAGAHSSFTQAAWHVVGRDGSGVKGIGQPEAKVRRIQRAARARSKTENK